MGKFKKAMVIILGLTVYMLVGAIIYFCIKNYYRPEGNENSRYIYNAIEITDENDITRALLDSDTTYALVYGNFESVDSIEDKFLNGTFSYIDEIKIDNRKDDEVRESNKKISTTYSMNGTIIEGLNFDIIEPVKYRTINDIRNRKITYEYYTKDSKYFGTMLCKLDKGMLNIIDFYENKTIESVRDDNNHGIIFTENLFLVAWAVFFMMIIIGIEDSNENPDDFKIDVRRR